MAKCPHTGVSVPECSCYRCLEEQIRRFMPGLLEQHQPQIRIRRRTASPARRPSPLV